MVGVVLVLAAALAGWQSQFLAPAAPAAPVTVSVKVPAPPPAQPLPANLGSGEYRELDLRALTQAVPVYTYHDIIASRSQKGAVWFDCTVAEFEAQLRFLAAKGARPVTLAQLQEHLTLGTRLPPRAVVLTFDDNYQGFYDHAYPLLKRYGYPAAVFVHTDYVGVKTGDHPKMDWDELLQLDREGLVTIGAHTRSHPADLAKLSVEEQDRELKGSKEVLEERLGHPVNFQSYANGKGNAVTFERARRAGYTLGFLEFWGPVEQSPGILQLNRYIHIQLQRGWNETYGPDAAPLAALLPLTAGAASSSGTSLVGSGAAGLRLVRGGRTLPPGLMGRPLQLVPDAGAAAGSGENGIAAFQAAAPGTASPSLEGRPLLVWGGSGAAILPFVSGLSDHEAALRRLMPDLSQALLGRAWLVHEGRPLGPAALAAYGAADARRLSRRAFVGFTQDGVMVRGESLGPVSALGLARLVARAGLREAVMLAPP